MSGITGQNLGKHSGLVKAASGGGGEWTLILTQTASSSANISFTSGLDSTYDEYCFKFNNIHAATTNADLLILASIDAGSNYNAAISTTYVVSKADEGDSSTEVSYEGSHDAHSSTTGAKITIEQSTSNDACSSGYLYLYNPAGTTYTKLFMSDMESAEDAPKTFHCLVSGYANTTSAVNAIQFKFSSGNIDAGTISLYGIG